MSVTDREIASADATPEIAQRKGSPPRRPGNFDELGFERRKPVRWFSPSTLARSGIKVILSMVLGEYLDKRELQQSLPPRIPPTTLHGRGDVGGLRRRHRRRLQPHLHRGVVCCPSPRSPSPGMSCPAPTCWCSAVTRCIPTRPPRSTRTGSAGRTRLRCRGCAEEGAAHRGHPRQPRLVRRAHRVHAGVRPEGLGRRASAGADPQLLRRTPTRPILAVGHRHPGRRLPRRGPDRLLPDGGEDDGRRATG